MLASVGAVLGIDVGCSPTRKSSALCLLSWTADRLNWTIKRFRAVEAERAETIGQVTFGKRLLAAAFDGPIRADLDEIGRYRTAERMLTRRLQKSIGKPGQASAPVGKALNKAASDCVRNVLTLCDVQNAQHAPRVFEQAIVEAFPSSFLGVMIDLEAAPKVRRNTRSDSYFQHLARDGTFASLLHELLPGREITNDIAAVTNHDDRAGLVCAITALCAAAGDFVAVGDKRDGWIILPPERYLQQHALDALSANASEEPEVSLRFSRPVSDNYPTITPSAEYPSARREGSF